MLSNTTFDYFSFSKGEDSLWGGCLYLCPIYKRDLVYVDVSGHDIIMHAYIAPKAHPLPDRRRQLLRRPQD